MEIKNEGFFSSVDTYYNDTLDKIKEKIMDKRIKVISFDIFDTLITRPFLYPKDLFTFMNDDYRKLSNNLSIDFSKIREDCEMMARTEAYNNKKEEIKLDRIYEFVEKEYDVPKNISQILKQKEIDLELRFCKRRESTYSLYKLAKYMGKRVICTSDMYLPINVIKEILNKNGFDEIDKIYLSSEKMKTKATGNLYECVINEESIEPNEIMHIGDNYKTDHEIADNKKMHSIYYPKATDIMEDRYSTNNLAQMLFTSMPFWRDNQASINFIGIRTIIAIVANKYFDNPFKTFNRESDFNIDPYLIGYYAVGSYMFGVANWLLRENENKGYKNLVFMARDGYLPMEIYNKLKKYYSNVPESKYLRVSRKSLISAMLINKMDLYKLTDVININNHSPQYIIKYIKNSLKDYSEEKIKGIIEKNGIKYEENIGTKQKFNKLVKVISQHLFDENKNNIKTKKLKDFFTEYFVEKSSTFDVGYSGRPEMYLSILCEKPIDTFFLNINQDEALKYSKVAGYNLKTYFNGKPSVTGFAYESIISELGPSTIGYDLSGEKVMPILEENNKSYQERYVIGVMQEAAKQFIDDILNIFGDEFKKLYYQDYYISLPFISYINSSKNIDMQIFNSIGFEDTVRSKDIKPITENWLKERDYRNQRSMNSLINRNQIVIRDSYLNYNNVVYLENRNKFVRAFYYAIFDKPTFKRRIKEILRM